MDFTACLNSLKQIYNQEIGVLNKLEEDKSTKSAEIKQLADEKASLDILKILLQDASKKGKENASTILEQIGANGLKFVYGDYMSLKINLNHDASEADFEVSSEYTNYTVETDPADGDGGGVADVVATSDYMGMLELISRKTNNKAPLRLDEPSKYVSKEHREPFAKFLYQVSNYYKRQVIMVTHDDSIIQVADKAYRFAIDDKGRSHATPA